MFIRVPEAHSRSLVKAVSWRIVGSLDTFIISWVVTGKLRYAGMILGVETFTKIALYYYKDSEKTGDSKPIDLIRATRPIATQHSSRGSSCSSRTP